MSFANSATLQARTIGSLVLRRFQTRHQDSRAGYAWAILEPMMWVFVLKFGFQGGAHALVPPPLGTSYEVFFATGVVIARTWRTTITPIAGAITRGVKGSLPFASSLDQAYAIWVLDMATGGMVMVVILAILGLWGFHVTPNDTLKCLAAYGLFCIFTLSFALAIAVILAIFPVMKRFMPIILMIMFFTSGFATLLDRMPPSYRDIVVWNPMVHVIEWFREGFYPNYECFNKDLTYTVTFTITCLLFGLVGERAMRRRIAAGRAR